MAEMARIKVGFDAWLNKPHQLDYEIRFEDEDGNEIDFNEADATATVAELESCLLGEYAVENEGDRISFFADDSDSEKLDAIFKAWEARGAAIYDCYDEWQACKDDEEN